MVALKQTIELNQILGSGLDALDISAQGRDLVIRRYTALGHAYDDHWQAARGTNEIFAQGSFALGTVVRSIHRNDDIDIDIVAVRDLFKSSTSQEQLKRDSGVAIKSYARTPRSGAPTVSECSRCWTLTWAGMHLDVLPAIPHERGSQHGVHITDRDVARWQSSNPKEYANWFKGRMASALTEERVILAKSLNVDDVPDWEVKTALQRAVQALKRHRDIYFAKRLDARPSSVVITTLAAMSYDGGMDIYEVLRSITGDMARHIHRADGVWTLLNPTQPDENFMDSWAADPAKAAAFFEWLEIAQEVFESLGARSGLHNVLPLLGSAFGERFEKAASLGAGLSVVDARRQGTLRATGGALAVGTAAEVGGRPVRDHRFAGGSKSH